MNFEKSLPHLALSITIGVVLAVVCIYIYPHPVLKTLNKNYQQYLQVNDQYLATLSEDEVFMDTEEALRQFLQSPTGTHRVALLEHRKKLDQSLDRIAQFYGYRVKRWIDLYRVWEHDTVALLLDSPSEIKNSPWKLTFLQYQRLIGDEISRAYNDYQSETYGDVLYRTYSLNTLRSSSRHKMQKLYREQVLPLMNDAISTLKTHRNSILNCLPDRAIDGPKKIAENIARLQYQSRYCPLLVHSRINNPCEQIKYITVADKKQDAAIQTQLATCEIADQRLQEETTRAQQQYGTLAYDDYFSRYVEPLVPKYKAQLEIADKTEKTGFACNPDTLPQVNFRNPEVDAQTAAYERYAATLCHAFFAHPTDRFRQLQHSLYVYSKENLHVNPENQGKRSKN